MQPEVGPSTTAQTPSSYDLPVRGTPASSLAARGAQRNDGYYGSGSRTSQEPTSMSRNLQPAQDGRSSIGTVSSRPSLNSTVASGSLQSSSTVRSRGNAGEVRFEHRLQTQLRTFAAIPRGDFTHVGTYVRENQAILSADPRLLLDEAVRAHAAGKTQYSNSLVQQAVILKMYRREPSKTFFRDLANKDSSIRAAFYTEFDNALKQTREDSISVSATHQLLLHDPKIEKDDDFEASTESPSSLAPKQTKQRDDSASTSTTNAIPYYSTANVHSSRQQTVPAPEPLLPAGGEITMTHPHYQSLPIVGSPPNSFQGNPAAATYNSSTFNPSKSPPKQEQALQSPRNVDNIPLGRVPSSRVRATDTLMDLPDTLDHRYKVYHSSFYHVGRVFAVPWPVPAGETAKSPESSRYTHTSNPTMTTGRFGQKFYNTIRRMVVVRASHGFCVCIQINTYAGRGLSKFAKSNTDVQNHSIVYMDDTNPVYLQNEPRTLKNPIAVTKSQAEHRLDIASRLCYARPHTVEHNVKAMNIGTVTGKCLQDVLRYYALINNIN